MSSKVNGRFAFVLVLGPGVCAKAEVAIAQQRVRIFQRINLSPLSAQTPAVRGRAQLGRTERAYINRSTLLPSIALL
jgi:hypothetical protein